MLGIEGGGQSSGNKKRGHIGGANSRDFEKIFPLLEAHSAYPSNQGASKDPEHPLVPHLKIREVVLYFLGDVLGMSHEK